MATTMEASQMLIQSETHVSQRTYTEVSSTTERVKKSHSRKKSMKKNKDDSAISVSKSSEKLHKKMRAATDGAEVNPNCAKCARPVYAMERVKAERRVWHKECFRCVECNKQLTVETYQSNHTSLYCKQHFKSLFAPKAVEGEVDARPIPKKHQMIICESNPKELPPDVVRASDKPDLGLEELSSLDVKSRFEMFENAAKSPEEPPPPEHRVERTKSSALLSRLAKFKSKGMDVGVSDDYLNGVPIEPSSSEAEDDDEDSVLKKSYKHTATREAPVSLCNMSEVVGRFEAGDAGSAERHRERKLEIQNIRNRLFLGKQAKIKEMYEQSVMQSEHCVTSAEKIARELDVDTDRARSIKQRFENGELFADENQPPRNRDIEDEGLFNEGIGKKSRSIFLELDANAKNLGPQSPPAKYQEPPRRKEIPFIPKDIVRSVDKVDDVQIETSDISNKFQFFETYRPQHERREFRMTPPRQQQRKSPSPEVYRDPEVVRSDEGDAAAGAGLAAQRHTASRMISVFKQMEQEQARKEENLGPKPLKSITPPPPGTEYRAPSSSDEYGSSSEYEDDSEDEQRRYVPSERDEALQQARALAQAKNLRNRFENWSETEPQRSPSTVFIERGVSQDDDESQIETAKSLRAKFENMKTQPNNGKMAAAPRVNRFV